MSYVAEFTNDIRYIKGSGNCTADALSHITINNIEYFRVSIDYEEIASAQTADASTLDFISNPDKTSLKLEQFCIPGKSLLIWCNTSARVVRPFIPTQFRKMIFDKIHLLSHPGIAATINLIKQRFVWPNMKKGITSWVCTYWTCQSNKV